MTAQQPQHPRVGDTLTVVIHVAAPAGAIVQARTPADSSLATLTGPPVVSREGSAVRIAYPIAVWTPGQQQLVIPGPIVVTLSGRVDTLADVRVPLSVASVLPPGKAVTTLPPRPARPWLPRSSTSALPLGVLVPVAVLFAAALQWWWRRRGTALPPAPRLDAELPLDPARVEAWLSAGEVRLVLDHLAWQVRHRDDFADWREQADALRFAAGDAAPLEALAREGWQRLQQVDPTVIGVFRPWLLLLLLALPWWWWRRRRQVPVPAIVSDTAPFKEAVRGRWRLRLPVALRSTVYGALIIAAAGPYRARRPHHRLGQRHRHRDRARYLEFDVVRRLCAVEPHRGCQEGGGRFRPWAT